MFLLWITKTKSINSWSHDTYKTTHGYFTWSCIEFVKEMHLVQLIYQVPKDFWQLITMCTDYEINCIRYSMTKIYKCGSLFQEYIKIFCWTIMLSNSLFCISYNNVLFLLWIKNKFYKLNICMQVCIHSYLLIPLNVRYT